MEHHKVAAYRNNNSDDDISVPSNITGRMIITRTPIISGGRNRKKGYTLLITQINMLITHSSMLINHRNMLVNENSILITQLYAQWNTSSVLTSVGVWTTEIDLRWKITTINMMKSFNNPTIDHHGPSMCSDHYIIIPLSNVAKISFATTAILWSSKWFITLPAAYIVMYKFITQLLLDVHCSGVGSRYVFLLLIPWLSAISSWWLRLLLFLWPFYSFWTS